MTGLHEISTFRGSHGALNAANFYQVRFEESVLQALISRLQIVANAQERCWHSLTSTDEDFSRIRIYKIRTPDFEMRAFNRYLRGTVFRISGQESMNIDFSVDGALLLATRLQAAKDEMRSFVLLRLPHRKKPIIEFIADIELEQRRSGEHDRLGQVGQSMAVEVWGDEDFSDWET